MTDCAVKFIANAFVTEQDYFPPPHWQLGHYEEGLLLQ